MLSNARHDERWDVSGISFKQVALEGAQGLSGRVFELVSKELGGEQSIEEIERVIDYKHGAVVLGGFVGDEMVCMNAFMPMLFSDGTNQILGYQSGFSATSSEHRGKGYWPKLLIASEGILAGMGASFIFGYPNEVSHPLFVKKLDYTTLPTARSRIATVPGLFEHAFF
jgi:hypothetical protein